MKTLQPKREFSRQARSEKLRAAVLGCFGSNAAEAVQLLSAFNTRQWQRNYYWMDASGMALYLLHKLRELHREDVVPVDVIQRLRRNAADNIRRTHSLFKEAAAIAQRLESAGIPFAVLKGFTLSPDSVPDPALRCQLDLDFLLPAEDAEVARQVLISMGYRLDVVSGDTWEFKAGDNHVACVDDLYKEKPQRSAELHLIRDGNADTRLRRAQSRLFERRTFPVLCPTDAFVGQALHLYAHLLGPFTRASWLLEFYRHVLAHDDGSQFWRDVKTLAAGKAQAALAIGIVISLAEECFGPFAPQTLRSWTVDLVRPAVRLWIKSYGRRYLLADFPGTKLCLLLQQAVSSDTGLENSKVRRRLFPLLWPRMISHAGRDESCASKLKRCLTQFTFFLSRLRFHVFEGIRYAVEYLRWRRLIAEVGQ